MYVGDIWYRATMPVYMRSGFGGTQIGIVGSLAFAEFRCCRLTAEGGWFITGSYPSRDVAVPIRDLKIKYPGQVRWLSTTTRRARKTKGRLSAI